MILKEFKPVFDFLKISAVLYVLHKLAFYLFESEIKPVNFYFPIEILYAFYIITGVTVLSIAVIVKRSNLDNVGMTFLLATNVNMIFCYLMLRPILAVSAQSNGIEKNNFFMMFIVFLATETIITIRLLNKK